MSAVWCSEAASPARSWVFFFNDTATTEIYTLSLHDALPIYPATGGRPRARRGGRRDGAARHPAADRETAPAAARREDAGGLRRQHRDDGRGARPAGAAREVQGSRDSQGQAVRRSEGVGLRLRRAAGRRAGPAAGPVDRKSTRLNSSHSQISYAVFCLKKKNKRNKCTHARRYHSSL